nr:Chain A, SMRT corepressor SP1 fragment [Homo sapiens]
HIRGSITQGIPRSY